MHLHKFRYSASCAQESLLAATLMDIKRLNKERAGITITRHINGQTYTLPPNDNRYALLIPEDISCLTQIPQNPADP